MSFENLPVVETFPALQKALRRGRTAVLQAPPGAGKTTCVPLALLTQEWMAGKKIIMLEPRRLAARTSAARMAFMLGEPVGKTIGYRVRQDNKVSAKTRIEVVTEGILTRRLQSDPELARVGLVIFDEFHERSLTADLGLALTKEVQDALRDDLRILVMSATLDGEPVARLLGGAPIITSEGKMFPVETRHLPVPPVRGAQHPDMVMSMAQETAVRQALAEETGSILVFLPGEREIRRLQGRLAKGGLDETVSVLPLFGSLPLEEQERAIRPAPEGQRKVVLATSIAETSLTIEGVRVVIDSGQARHARFDPASGMGKLVTTRVTRAEADQRRGRAGRREPGICYRLWSEAEDRALIPFPAPEICQTDLAPLALDLLAWGASANGLAWLDNPPAGALAQGMDLLRTLGALDGQDHLTVHGRKMAALAVHPRLAHMMVRADEEGEGGMACDLAALLSERDLLRINRDSDMRRRLTMLASHSRHGDCDPGVLSRVRQLARDWRKSLGIDDPVGTWSGSAETCGRLLALAYPDRVASRRANGSFVLSGGRGAILADNDGLVGEDWLAVADMDGAGANGKIYRAAPVSAADIEEMFVDQLCLTDTIVWSDRDQAVLARRQKSLGALVIAEEPLNSADPDQVTACLVGGIRKTGLHVLPWDKDSEQFCARVEFLRARGDDSWPDLSQTALAETLETWLAPYLSGMSRLSHLRKVSLSEALRAQMSWDQLQKLDQQAPSRFVIPTGENVRLHYENTETPVLAVRIQKMFGCSVHPCIGGGKIPLIVHLLSPAGRPMQITQDLPGFWANSYAAVKADLRGRYPKHPWPDDPLAAEPTSRAKPRAS